MSDLDKIIPQPVVLTVAGKEITIQTMKVKQLSLIIKAASPFMPLFKGKVEDLDVAGLVVGNLDAAIEMVSILVSEDKEWINDLGVDELVELFSAVVAVNLDFFTLKVLPALSEAMAKVGVGRRNLVPVSGPASSSN